ncbi:Hypothetical predicted protein, partial [Pelobates cultripes]
MARYRAREPLAGQNRPENGKGRVPMMMIDPTRIRGRSRARMPMSTPLMRKGAPMLRQGLTLRCYLRAR